MKPTATDIEDFVRDLFHWLYIDYAHCVGYVWRISAVLNKKQKSIIVSDPLYAPVLPASPTSTRGLTQPRIFFRYLQDFGNPIV